MKEQRDAATAEKDFARLKEVVKEAGLTLEGDWSCDSYYRNDGKTVDHEFLEKSGPKVHRFRSYISVVKHLDPSYNGVIAKVGQKAKAKTGGKASKVAHSPPASPPAAGGDASTPSKPPGSRGKAEPPTQQDEWDGKQEAAEDKRPTLTRDEAAREAKTALENLHLPHTVHSTKGAKFEVTSLGSFDPSCVSGTIILPEGYSCVAHTASLGEGNSLLNEIREGGDRPNFSVSLKTAAGETIGVATGSTIDQAWANVVRLQNEAKSGEATDGGSSNAHEGIEVAKAALAAAEALDEQPGLFWFGLLSEPVIRAIEGLEGVEACKEYSYIRQSKLVRTHIQSLRKQWKKGQPGGAKPPAAGKASVPKAPAAKAPGKGQQLMDGFMSGKTNPDNPLMLKRKREEEEQEAARLNGDLVPIKSPKKSHKKVHRTPEQEVALLVNGMVDKVARDSLEAKKEKGKQERAQKEKEKANREAEKVKKNAGKAAKEGAGKGDASRAAGVKEQAGPRDDRELPGGDAAPPKPEPLPGCVDLVANIIPGLVELHQLVCRFHHLLDLDEVPELSDMVDAAVSPAADGSDPFNSVMAAMTRAVAFEAVEAALEVATSTNEDLRTKDYLPSFPNLQGKAWCELARRLFCLGHVSGYVAMDGGSGMSGGLDAALGDFVGSSPLGLLGPTVVLQGLLGGAACHDLLDTCAALPLGACPASAAVRSIRMDCKARRAQEARLHSSSTADGNITVTCRRLLRHIDAVKGPKKTDGTRSRGSVLFFDGEKAAITAKWARPLDLHTLSMWNDNGLYGCQQDGVRVFVADVLYVCDLFLAASGVKRSNHAHTLSGQRVPDIAKSVKALVAELLPSALDGSLKAPGKPRSKAATPEGTPAAEEGSAVEDSNGNDVDTDLSLPLNLVANGCCVCWTDEDTSRIIICDECQEEFHLYCLQPPLDEVPGGTDDWFCPSCAKDMGGQAPSTQDQPPPPSLPDTAGGDFAAAALSLRGKEVDELSLEERARTAALMSFLFESTAMVRLDFSNSEEAKKEMYRQKQDLQKKVKKLKTEEKARAQGIKPDPSAAKPRTRQGQDVQLEIARDQSRIDELTRQIDAHEHIVREDPAGCDRHWNRYWVLGSCYPGHPGLLCVERCDGGWYRGTEAGPERWKQALKFMPREAAGQEGGSASKPATSWGCYPDRAAVEGLVSYLNPKGLREAALLPQLQKHLDRLRRAEQAAVDQQAEAAQPMEVDEADDRQESAAAGEDTAGADEPGDGAAPAPDTDMAIEEEGGPGAAPPPASTEVSDLQAELFALVDDQRNEQLPCARATPARLDLWRSLLEQASTPQDLMAALLLAEDFFLVAQLKPWWRLWTSPIPTFTFDTTLSGVKMRLRKFKEALKKASASRFPSRAVAEENRETGGLGRYPARANRAPAGALNESRWQVDVESEDERGGQRKAKPPTPPKPLYQESNGIRATRNAAKKSRRGEEEDERAGRSLRPRKGVSYKLEDGSGSDSEAEEEQYQSESEGEDEKDDAEVGDDEGEPESEAGGKEGGAEESGEQSQGPENGVHENGDGGDSEGSDLLGETVEVAGRKRLRKARD